MSLTVLVPSSSRTVLINHYIYTPEQEFVVQLGDVFEDEAMYRIAGNFILRYNISPCKYQAAIRSPEMIYTLAIFFQFEYNLDSFSAATLVMGIHETAYQFPSIFCKGVSI